MKFCPGIFCFRFSLGLYFKIFIGLKNWLHCLRNLEPRDISHERGRKWAAGREVIHMNWGPLLWKWWSCLTRLRFRFTLTFLFFLKFSKINISLSYNLNHIEQVSLTWGHKRRCSHNRFLQMYWLCFCDHWGFLDQVIHCICHQAKGFFRDFTMFRRILSRRKIFLL